MKSKNRFLLLFSWIALAVTPDHATQAAGSAPSGSSGTVTGRVQNVATGSYLNSARVAVRGTGLVAFTDHTGTYRLNNVPTGPAVLEVFYTGLDPQAVSLTVPAGRGVVQNVDLTSVARYGERKGVVKLDSFVVASSREMAVRRWPWANSALHPISRTWYRPTRMVTSRRAMWPSS